MHERMSASSPGRREAEGDARHVPAARENERDEATHATHSDLMIVFDGHW